MEITFPSLDMLHCRKKLRNSFLRLSASLEAFFLYFGAENHNVHDLHIVHTECAQSARAYHFLEGTIGIGDTIRHRRKERKEAMVYLDG